MQRLIFFLTVLLSLMTLVYVKADSAIETYDSQVISKDVESDGFSTAYYVTMTLDDSKIKINVNKDIYDKTHVGDTTTLYEKDNIFSLTEFKEGVVKQDEDETPIGNYLVIGFIALVIGYILGKFLWQGVDSLIY